MAVKPGYKQTDVGVIPAEWEVKRLKKISPSQSVGLVINPSSYFDKAGTVPMLVGSNVSENAIDSSVANCITSESNEFLTASRLNAGDLVVVRVGDPGVTAVVPPELDGCNCASMMIVRQHQSFNSNWLCCMMNSRYGRKQVEHVQYGTAQKQFNISDAVNFQYPVPPFREQDVIATALGNVDALLNSLDRLIAKKRDLKQAAMQQLLTGQTRLPGFSGDWETYTVEELERRRLVKLSRGKVISKKDIESRAGDFPIYSSSIHNDGLFGQYGDFMFEEELITWSVDGGGNFFYRPKHKFSVTNVCGYMRVDTSKICYRYFAAHLQQLHSRKSFDYQSKAHPSVIRKEYQVQLPPLDEQKLISEVLTAMDAELMTLNQRRNKAIALKQGMMQELLTGKTRLV